MADRKQSRPPSWREIQTSNIKYSNQSLDFCSQLSFLSTYSSDPRYQSNSEVGKGLSPPFLAYVLYDLAIDIMCLSYSAWCLKVTQKVALNIASVASNVHILSNELTKVQQYVMPKMVNLASF